MAFFWTSEDTFLRFLHVLSNILDHGIAFCFLASCTLLIAIEHPGPKPPLNSYTCFRMLGNSFIRLLCLLAPYLFDKLHIPSENPFICWHWDISNRSMFQSSKELCFSIEICVTHLIVQSTWTNSNIFIMLQREFLFFNEHDNQQHMSCISIAFKSSSLVAVHSLVFFV